MTVVWDNYPGRSTELLLALKLADTANDDGTSIFKTVDTMARQTRMSVRAVQSLLRQMEETGFLVVTKHALGGRGHAREYSVNPRWLANPSLPLDGALKNATVEALESATTVPTKSTIKGAESAPFSNVKGAESAPFPNVKGADSCNKGCKQLHPLAVPHIYVTHPNPSPFPPLFAKANDEGFLRWWQAYPKGRRVGKAKCERLWQRKGLEPQADAVIDVLQSDIASAQWCRDEGQFIPLTLTWLSQDRFEREALPDPNKHVCVVCGAEARCQIGWRHLCGAHFDERATLERFGDDRRESRA